MHHVSKKIDPIQKSVSHLSSPSSLSTAVVVVVFPKNINETSRSLYHIVRLTNVIAYPINKRRLDDLFFILFFLPLSRYLVNPYNPFPHSAGCIVRQAYMYQKIVTIEQLRSQTFFSSLNVSDRMRARTEEHSFFGTTRTRIIIRLVSFPSKRIEIVIEKKFFFQFYIHKQCRELALLFTSVHY